MARSRSKAAQAAAETPATEPEKDIFDQVIASRQQEAAPVAQDAAPATEIPQETHANKHAPAKSYTAAIEKKKNASPPDPFNLESLKAGENRVVLLKSEGEGAWVIRFAHNPNDDKGPNGETYSKENPHPVLTMLKKEEGYRWGFDGGDGKGGWGKAFSGDPYGADLIAARRVLKKAAEMIGAPMPEQSRIPD